MKQRVNLPIPVISTLRKLGRDINEARRRQRITVKLMAERAGVSAYTIWKIEKGDPGTSIGGYAAVLYVLGMTDRLSDIADATHDFTGRRLYEERFNLPKRVRLPARRKEE